MKGRNVQTSATNSWQSKELFTVLLCPHSPVQQSPESSDFSISVDQLRQKPENVARFLEEGGKSLAAREFLRALSPCLAHPDAEGNLLPIIRVEKELGSLYYGVNFDAPRVTLDECWQSFVHQLDEVVGLKTTQVSLNSLEGYTIKPLTVCGRRGTPNAPAELGVNSILTVYDFNQIKNQVEAGSASKESNVDLDSAVVAAWNCGRDSPAARKMHPFICLNYFKGVVSDAIEKCSHKHFITSQWNSMFDYVIQTVGEKEKRLRYQEKRDLGSIAMSLHRLGCRDGWWPRQKELYIQALKEFATQLSTLSTFTTLLENQEPVECLTRFVNKQLALVNVGIAMGTGLTEWRAKARDIGEQVQELETDFETFQTEEAVHSIKKYLVELAQTFQKGTEEKIADYNPHQKFKLCLMNVHSFLEMAEAAALAWIASDEGAGMTLERSYNDVMGDLYNAVIKLEELSSVVGASDEVDKAKFKFTQIQKCVAVAQGTVFSTSAQGTVFSTSLSG